MNANCVNVLNKTVSDVCLLDKNVKQNTEDIEFLFKYMQFTKNLQLAYLGCDVQINACVCSFPIQTCFIKDKLLEFYLVSILEYLNNQYYENYYFIATNSSDIPALFRNNSFQYPCVVEIGLISCDKYKLVSIIDSTKAQDYSMLKDVVLYLQETLHCNLPQYALAILQFLTKSPDIYLQKCDTKSLSSSTICQAYSSLQTVKKETHELFCSLVNQYKRHYTTNTVIEAVNYYIKKASDILYFEYKQKSFNNPFISPPTQHDIFEKARDLFLEANDLEINNCGIFVDSGPYEPNEPNEPSEPSDLSNLYFDVKTVIDYNNIETLSNNATNIDLIIENKIKKLLEMTETETTQTS
jgi:hypothetical protein